MGLLLVFVIQSTRHHEDSGRFAVGLRLAGLSSSTSGC